MSINSVQTCWRLQLPRDTRRESRGEISEYIAVVVKLSCFNSRGASLRVIFARKTVSVAEGSLRALPELLREKRKGGGRERERDPFESFATLIKSM